MSQQTILPFVLKAGTQIATTGMDVVSSLITPKRKIPNTVVSSTYDVPCNALKKEELQSLKRDLTMTPTDSGYGGSTLPPFEAFTCDEDWIRVPRFFGYKQWGAADVCQLSDGEKLDAVFTGSLNPVQKEATDATIAKLLSPPHGNFLVLPCGYGKTVCALYIASKLGRRTLVLVHKSFLVQQWQERANTFLHGVTLGKIQQNVADAHADVVVGMVQSVSKREYSADILSKFGTVIIDEAHHMSAPVFSKALRCLPCRYVLGLSATPERKDGMTPLLYHSMGEIAFRAERKPEHTLVSCILYEEGSRKEIKYKDGKVSMPLMLNALVKDGGRNMSIASRIKQYADADRRIIVLSDRIAQLKVLKELLVDLGVKEEEVAFYIGITPAQEREIASQKRVILSTYSMAKEGLDIPRLDTLVMATPKGDVVQASGRVQRKHQEKRIPLIVDFVDTFSVFEALRWKRWAFYKKEGFHCQTYDARNEEAQWFV